MFFRADVCTPVQAEGCALLRRSSACHGDGTPIMPAMQACAEEAIRSAARGGGGLQASRARAEYCTGARGFIYDLEKTPAQSLAHAFSFSLSLSWARVYALSEGALLSLSGEWVCGSAPEI